MIRWRCHCFPHSTTNVLVVLLAIVLLLLATAKGMAAATSLLRHALGRAVGLCHIRSKTELLSSEGTV